MTDTVKELRELAARLENAGLIGAVTCAIAANEIERLTARISLFDDEKTDYGQERWSDGYEAGCQETQENQ